MQLQHCLLTFSDPLSESCLSILVATSPFLFIHPCQFFQLSLSTESSITPRQISRAEIKQMLTEQLTKVDQSYGLKTNLKYYILIIFLFHFRFSPENGLWDDFN